MASYLLELQRKLEHADIDWQSTVMAVVLGVGLFEAWIGSRQKPYLNSKLYPDLPAVLKPYLSAPDANDRYRKSQTYAKDKLRYGSIIAQLDLLETFVLLSSVSAPVFNWLGLGHASQGSWPYFGKGKASWTLLSGLWNLSGCCYGASSAAGRSMAFVAILQTISAVLSLPKDYYKNFYLEEQHGFNKMTRQTFVLDAIKSYCLSMAIELPVLAGVVRIIAWIGDDGMFKLVAWLMLFIFAFQLVMIPLYPYVIAPLFNKYTPLPEDSPVFPRVKALAERLDFPLGKIWVIDGSKRSSHSNAFFFGLPLLTKHIVIYDTLLDKSSPEEVEAILAHELGHWKGNHVLVLLTTGLVQIGISLLTFTLVLSNQNLLRSFGLFVRRRPTATRPTIVSLMLAAMLFAPVSTFLNFITNTITRRLEYDADAFAFKLSSDHAKNLKGALVSIHEKNLALTLTDKLYSALHHNHPTLIERLEALDRQLEEDKKDQ